MKWSESASYILLKYTLNMKCVIVFFSHETTSIYPIIVIVIMYHYYFLIDSSI